MSRRSPAALPLEQVDPETATTTAIAVKPAVGMFERLAMDQSVPVEKLAKLIELQERIMAHDAKSAFNTAFAAMQGEIPVVVARRSGDSGKWMFAAQEDIVAVVRPILQKHGFSLSFRTEWPDIKTVKVIGILTHRDGHDQRSEFLAAADTTGSKNAVQALGSSITYGRRYTTCDLLNITTSDDDGAASEKFKQPETPEGFDDWWQDFQVCADEGIDALEAAWKKTKPEFKVYADKHLAKQKAGIKARAVKVAR